MARLEFEQLRFQSLKKTLRVILMGHYYFDIPNDIALACGLVATNGNSVEFEKISERKARQQVMIWLERHQQNLVNSLNGKQTAYVHRGSGLPLVGNTAFGIVDRGTNIIEVKPVTACNIRCVFCSVDEDQRPVDFVLEREYIVEELQKLVAFKGDPDIEILLGVQGEVFFYPELMQLIADMRKFVPKVSLITNGSFLTADVVHGLDQAGLTRMQVSVNALDPVLARKIAGASYDVSKIISCVEYVLSNTGIDVMIVPVYVCGLNDDEIPRIINWASRIGAGKSGPSIGLQNYLPYKHGKDPMFPSVSMEVFEEKLVMWEKQTMQKLHLSESDLHIHASKVYPKPLRKGEKVRALIWGRGRLKGEWLALIKDRNVSFFSNHSWTKNQSVNLCITRIKHNIFSAALI